MNTSEIQKFANDIIAESELYFDASVEDITQAVDATLYLDNLTVTPEVRQQIIGTVKNILPTYGWR
jgi:hypothetical protein